jgi:hypothetical protein
MLSFAELKNFLCLTRSDETAELVQNAVLVFDLYNVPGYMDVYARTMDTNQETNPNDLVFLLLDDTKTMLSMLLNVQGIVVGEQAEISDLIALTTATSDMVKHEDKQTINRFLETDESVEEIYAELVNFVSGFPIEKVLDLVDAITPNFTAMMKDAMQEPEVNLEASELLDKIVISYKKFKAIMKEESLYSDRFLSQNSTIGLDFKSYLNIYSKSGVHLKEHTPETYRQVAVDLFGMACLSCDGFNNHLVIIRGELSGIYPDIGSSTKVDIEIGKLLMEYVK